MNWMKGWRTIAFNSAAAVWAVVQATDVATIVPPAYVPWVALGVATVNMWLRTVTTTPVGVK